MNHLNVAQAVRRLFSAIGDQMMLDAKKRRDELCRKIIKSHGRSE